MASITGNNLSITGGVDNTGGVIQRTAGTLSVASGSSITGGAVTGGAGVALSGVALDGVSLSDASVTGGSLANTISFTGGANNLTNVNDAGAAVDITGGTMSIGGGLSGDGDYTLSAGTLALGQQFKANSADLVGGVVENDGGSISVRVLDSNVALDSYIVDGSDLTDFTQNGWIAFHNGAFDSALRFDGALTLGQDSILDVGSYDFSGITGTYIPIFVADSVTGAFSNFSAALLQSWNIVYRHLSNGDTEVDLANAAAITATPEPGTFLLTGVALLLGLCVQHWRRGSVACQRSRNIPARSRDFEAPRKD
ncbi:MAG TPA: hypothetical protein VGM43_02250 [Bryobacteraceae bacterium]